MLTAINKLRRCLLAIVVLLLFSLSATFFMLLNNKKAMAADLIFNDIALDHPAYQMCQQLLQIGAVKPFSGMCLAPFEKITAVDWNHALVRIGDHLGRIIPESAKFSSDNEISGQAIAFNLRHLSGDIRMPPLVSNNEGSRLFAYFMLEHCLMDRDHD